MVDKLHKVYDIYEADLNLGQILTKDGNCSKSFLGRRITAACQNNIGLFSRIVACPFPDAYTLGTVLNSLLHGKPLLAGVLGSYYNVNVVLTPNTVVKT